MSATGHKKFLFDLDFGSEDEAHAAKAEQLKKNADAKAAEQEAEDAVEEPEIVIPTFSEDDMAQARADGFEDGHAEATRDLSSAVEQRLADTLDAINTQVQNLFETYQQDREDHNRDAVAVATIIVRKLFPAMNMDKAIDEIGHMVTEALQRTSGEATLIVRVHPDMKDTVEAKANELAAMRGQDGAITVMPDDTIGEGDAAVEWDGGGMIRDSQLMWQEIDKVIERNLGEERIDGPRMPEPPAQESMAQEPTEQESIEQEPDTQPPSTLEVVDEAAVGDNEELVTESPAPPAASAEEQPQTPQETATFDPAPAEGQDAQEAVDSADADEGDALLDEILAEGDEETNEITNDEPEETDM